MALLLPLGWTEALRPSIDCGPMHIPDNQKLGKSISSVMNLKECIISTGYNPNMEQPAIIVAK